MNVIHQQAEQFLFEHAGLIAPVKAAWSCIHINFSDACETYGENLRARFAVSILQELLERKDGFICLCADGDIVLLFKGCARFVLLKLCEHFDALAAHNPQSGALSDDALVTVYDGLDRHWQAFFSLCQSKAFRTPHPALAVYPSQLLN